MDMKNKIISASIVVAALSVSIYSVSAHGSGTRMNARDKPVIDYMGLYGSFNSICLLHKNFNFTRKAFNGADLISSLGLPQNASKQEALEARSRNGTDAKAWLGRIKAKLNLSHDAPIEDVRA